MSVTKVFPFLVPEKVLEIDQLYSIHYFENHKNYFFSGERHDFWELIYVDRGEVIADTDRMDEPIHLAQGEILFFRPMEYHRTYSNTITGHNLLVVTFQTRSPAMEFFMKNTLFRIDEDVRQIAATLLAEARKAFTTESMVTSAATLQRKEDVVFGSEQMITMMIQWLLIRLIRNDYHPERDSSKVTSNYVDNAIVYMKQNLRNRISMEDICNYTNISRSQLQKAFRQRMGTSVMHYFIQLRMEEAKFLICSGNENYTEIAEEFCYSSVHHFSTQFRKITGMSPSEYEESILALTPHQIP